jgi:hypothetical protein
MVCNIASQADTQVNTNFDNNKALQIQLLLADLWLERYQINLRRVMEKENKRILAFSSFPCKPHFCTNPKVWFYSKIDSYELCWPQKTSTLLPTCLLSGRIFTGQREVIAKVTNPIMWSTAMLFSIRFVS